MTNLRLKRYGQVSLSLFVGLLIWEIIGWQFNSAFLAPVLGSSIPFVKSIAGWIASLFGNVITEDHPGALPRLIEFIGFEFIRDEYRALQSEGGFFLWNALKALQQSDFIYALMESLKLFATGLFFALMFGFTLGMAMARWRGLRIGLEHYILALYATPMAALIPFILSIFGFDFWPKVLVVFLFSLFPVLYNSLEGARSLKPDYLEVAYSFRTTEYRLWTDIILPYTLPYALTGFRQGVGRALVGMVAAEILLSATGLGGWLVDSSRAFDMAGVLAAIFVVTGLGAILMALVKFLEERFVPWRNSMR